MLIAVTHLLGAGHLTRAAAIARALAAAGHDVTLVSGGAPTGVIRLDGVCLIQLAPLHIRGTAFSCLLDEGGHEAGPETMETRRRVLLSALNASKPDVVITELFPFGRRVLSSEFLVLLEAAHASRPRPLIVASIRDILVAPEKPDRVSEAHARVARLYDAILVHGDPGLLPLDASWPVDGTLRLKLHYTGYVDESDATSKSTSLRCGVLVSAGSSEAGLSLLRVAAVAARMRPDLGWRLLVGRGIPDATVAEISRGLKDDVVESARPDYRVLLGQAHLSVSACGYNTAVDLLRTGAKAILVPFEAGRETEQRLRAECLAARGLARVLPEADLTADRLIDCVLASHLHASPPSHGVDLNGAARTVAVIEELVAGRCPRTSPAKPEHFDLKPLRAALDVAAERGAQVPLWWRDDDAVAANPALERLVNLAENLKCPLLIAAIPAKVESSLAERLRGGAQIRIGVHGLHHSNHAPAGEKPAEFGGHRSLSLLCADAAEALQLAREQFSEVDLLPVFVPPWNRLALELAEALPSLGYTGLSAVAGKPLAGLVRADVHVDLIDWRGSRSLVNPDRLIEMLAEAIETAPTRLIGILSHHRVHDSVVWAFLEELLALLAAHPAVTIRDPLDLFQARQANHDVRSYLVPAAGPSVEQQ